jgi:hypothetical protein
MLTRPAGFTVVELMLAIIIGGMVIGLATSLGVRSQRFHRELGVAGDRLDQVEQTAALLAVDLRAIAPGEGDIASGQARDTALQFRATIGSAVVCDTSGNRVSLAPAAATSPVLAAYVTPPVAGDTAWVLFADLGAAARWRARPITATNSDQGQCWLGGRDLSGLAAASSRVVLTLGAGEGGVVTPGSLVRVTRLSRYSLYRASDGGWYLGLREWNATMASFNAIQPVSGPFLSAARGGLAFVYRDSIGAQIPAGAADTRGIALIEVAVQSDSGTTGPRFGAFGGGSARSVFSIALRNRAR